MRIPTIKGLIDRRILINYIPRRDTSSRLNTLIGGRLFPGKHYLAKFNVQEATGIYHIDFMSSDQTKAIS